MPIIILFVLILSTFAPPLVPQNLSTLSQDIHTTCSNLLNHSHLAKPIHQALFCGVSLNDLIWKPLITQLGLLHLLVISGLHLGLIEKIIQICFSRTPRLIFPLTMATLSSLCLITHFQAPCLRAFFYFLSQRFQKKLRLNWSQPYCHFLSGNLCLFFFPHFWQSHSLLISWLVTLIVSQFHKNKLALAALVYLILLPWQLSFFLNSPLSIFVNAFLITPLIPLLFLFSIFDILALSLSLGTEVHWLAFYKLLNGLAVWLPKIEPQINGFSLFYLWIYLFIIQIICLWMHKRKRNPLACSKQSLSLAEDKSLSPKGPFSL